MKIILHGATNGSNFGDFIFADLFYKKLIEVNPKGKNLFFECLKYGVGSFFRRELAYNEKQTLKDLLSADLLVYFSGGYFGESKRSYWRKFKTIFRYDLIGLLFVLRRKPLVILGVGGGSVSLKLRRRILCMFMEKSLATTVRDEKTKKHFKDYGVSSSITVTSDTAQVITHEMLPPLDKNVKKVILEEFFNMKIIFLHMAFIENKYKDNINKIMKAVNAFLKVHEEYGVILSRDNVSDKNIEESIVYKQLNCKNIYCYKYENPWQLCSLLKEVDFVITTKLHVGIVSSTLSKSVLSFPTHSDKVLRYYEQIGEQKRCVPILEATSEHIYELMEEYHEKNICLPDEIRLAANKNLDILGDIINSLKQ